MTGLALGFAIYTYTASFALYIVVGIFMLGLALLDWTRLRRRLPELAVVVVLGFGLTLADGQCASE